MLVRIEEPAVPATGRTLQPSGSRHSGKGEGKPSAESDTRTIHGGAMAVRFPSFWKLAVYSVTILEA